MCQGCVDDGAVSQFVFDVIEAFRGRFPDEEFGGAHIVIGDANVNDDCVTWCLDRKNSPDLSEECGSFLRWLLTVPEDQRVPALRRAP